MKQMMITVPVEIPVVMYAGLEQIAFNNFRSVKMQILDMINKELSAYAEMEEDKAMEAIGFKVDSGEDENLDDPDENPDIPSDNPDDLVLDSGKAKKIICKCLGKDKCQKKK